MRRLPEVDSALSQLGERMRRARLAMGDSQAIFAARIGVSKATVAALESGSPTVAIGTWATALWAISRLEDLALVVEEKASLFDQLEQARARKIRQRAPRRKVLA